MGIYISPFHVVTLKYGGIASFRCYTCCHWYEIRSHIVKIKGRHHGRAVGSVRTGQKAVFVIERMLLDQRPNPRMCPHSVCTYVWRGLGGNRELEMEIGVLVWIQIYQFQGFDARCTGQRDVRWFPSLAIGAYCHKNIARDRRTLAILKRARSQQRSRGSR